MPEKQGPSEKRGRRAPGDQASSGDAVTAVEAPLAFDDALARLTAIIERLESGDLGLEESLREFEEGVRLARRTQDALDRAEAKVEKLLALDADGAPVVEELEVE